MEKSTISILVIILLIGIGIGYIVCLKKPDQSPPIIEPDEPDISEEPIEPIEPEEPILEPANLTIIAKHVILGKGHRFFLEIHLNNTGDLNAYNTTILASVNFTTKYKEATIYLQEDRGLLKDGSLRGSTFISIIDPGITEHFIPMDFLLGSRWIDNPIAFIAEPYGGYSFYILSDDITIG